MPPIRTASSSKASSSETNGPKTHPCTIVNAVLLPGNHQPWTNENFRMVTGLSELGFLDPDYATPGKKSRKLDQKQRDAISSYFSAVQDNPGILRLANLSEVPNYKAYSSVATKHFAQPGNLVETLVAVMEEEGIHPRQVYSDGGYCMDAVKGSSTWKYGAVIPFSDLLFGDEAKNALGAITPGYSTAIKSIHYRLWEKEKAVLKRLEQKRLIKNPVAEAVLGVTVKEEWDAAREESQTSGQTLSVSYELCKVEETTPPLEESDL